MGPNYSHGSTYAFELPTIKILQIIDRVWTFECHVKICAIQLQADKPEPEIMYYFAIPQNATSNPSQS